MTIWIDEDLHDDTHDNVLFDLQFYDNDSAKSILDDLTASNNS